MIHYTPMMPTVEEFRAIALSMPEAVERAHMDHPDFRVSGKIFATLARPDEGWGMVKLKPQQQRRLVRSFPGVFRPAQGAWGTGGATYVRLDAVTSTTLRSAIVAAWRNTAPKHVVEESGPPGVAVKKKRPRRRAGPP